MGPVWQGRDGNAPTAAVSMVDGDHNKPYGPTALPEARCAGEVLPLLTILGRVAPITGDETFEIEVEEDDGRQKWGILCRYPMGGAAKITWTPRPVTCRSMKQRNEHDGSADR